MPRSRPSHRLLLALLVAAALLLVGGRAGAELESTELRAGVAAFEALDYEAAVEHLGRALRETLTTEEQVVTYRTLAFARVALDQPAAAKRAFENLLGVDPTYQPDRT